ncbi:MAG TPA: shikimate kinase [Flavobacteriaceae bacterium]|jgi:shikimate kinase|nr:shikimate kinase [Flavobacteriaceae bacterium]HBS11295.1 shikimate kinase [Flavobacteriaceae bacterium]
MKVILLGYMASGKTSIGKKLAKRLNLTFIDLDDYISLQEKLSVTVIFKKKGEIYFRKKETHYLKELLESNQNFILALGGGTPCYGDNLKIINSYTTSFYLKRSLNDTYSKLSKFKNKNKRPLIASIANDDLKEFIAKHLFERAPFYEQATHTIIIEAKTKKEIVKEIGAIVIKNLSST